MVGNLPSSVRQAGWNSTMRRRWPFEVMPCCAGEAPLIAEAQLGLLRVGRTPRASRVQAERAISSRRRGMRAVATPSTLKTSTPTMMTRGPCQAPEGSAKAAGQQASAITSGSNFVLGPILYSALSENLTERPLLRNFLHPLNREELDVGNRHPLGLQQQIPQVLIPPATVDQHTDVPVHRFHDSEANLRPAVVHNAFDVFEQHVG